MRKLTYFVAASVDGFIGEPGGEAGFFTEYVDEEFFAFLKEEFPETMPTHARQALGIDGLENRRFDTIVQGRASYDVALKEGVTSPFAHMRQYVASRSMGQSPDPAVEIISEDLAGRVRALKQEDGELDVHLCGGAARGRTARRGRRVDHQELSAGAGLGDADVRLGVRPRPVRAPVRAHLRQRGARTDLRQGALTGSLGARRAPGRRAWEAGGPADRCRSR